MKSVVIIPTYNERAALPDTLARARRGAPDVDVLIVDDASPDGTGAFADTIAAADDGVHVLHRPRKAGLGRAYVAGFGWALSRGYDLVLEMDADGSHHPEDIPRLVAAASSADLAIGSRWLPGGRTENWPWTRIALSKGANGYVRAALGLPVRDATAGFRAFRSSLLRRLDLDGVNSQGYCFQIDMTRRAEEAGARIVEVPITFTERERGTSKMSRAIILEALIRTTAWGAVRRTRQLVGLLGRDQALRRRN